MRRLTGVALRTTSWTLGAVVALLIVPGSPRAASEIGETAFQFLTLGAGAREEALGAGTVLSRGAGALAWNPALLQGIRTPTISASWFNWLTDVQAGHVSAAAPLGRGSVGLLAQSLSISDFRNVPGSTAIGQSDLAVSVGGAYPVVERLDAGASLRLIRSSLADQDASGWAGDAGLNYRYVEGWNVAAAVRNAGPAFGYGNGLEDQLPTQSALGVAGTLGELRFGLEGFWENGPGWRTAIGAEYLFRDRIALRAGSRVGDEPDGAVEPWSAGIGLKARRGLELDYAFRDGAFDASHRLGVQWTLDRSLDEPGEELARSPRDYYADVVNNVMDQAMVDFPRNDVTDVVVRASGTHAAASLIAETVAGRLREMGLTAEAGEPPPDVPVTGNPEDDAAIRQAMEDAGTLGTETDRTVLEFDVRESRYAILRESRERWIGPRSIEREAVVGLDLRLMPAGTDEPIWSFSGDAQRTERVAAHQVPKSQGYPRAGGTAKGERKMHPLVEPAIVGGIVTGLAVIFFANRDVSN
ncbi:MAG: hypothetical protein DHS20C21_19290 [Gemmatimonadota bacterium]|nr:MAG: hypothetical protein DHS20C21_19290 [Gemmatimonadota bacterium]